MRDPQFCIPRQTLWYSKKRTQSTHQGSSDICAINDDIPLLNSDDDSPLLSPNAGHNEPSSPSALNLSAASTSNQSDDDSSLCSGDDDFSLDNDMADDVSVGSNDEPSSPSTDQNDDSNTENDDDGVGSDVSSILADDEDHDGLDTYQTATQNLPNTVDSMRHGM